MKYQVEYAKFVKVEIEAASLDLMFSMMII